MKKKPDFSQDRLVFTKKVGDLGYSDNPTLGSLVSQYGEMATIRVISSGYSSDDVDVIIEVTRAETDEEYGIRQAELQAIQDEIAAEKKVEKLTKLDKERQEYERLKKKFG